MWFVRLSSKATVTIDGSAVHCVFRITRPEKYFRATEACP